MHAPRPVTRLAERVSQILSARGLTFAKLSRDAERLLPSQPRCRIPRNFHKDLVTTAVSPDIFQLFTLSVVSGCRLADWFSLFGFASEQIPRLQLSLPPKRTALVDATRHESLPEFSFSIPPGWSTDSICPLIQFLRSLDIRRVTRRPFSRNDAYQFARVGREDAFAFPDLLPGSLVRLDTRNPQRWLPRLLGSVSDVIFLAEHARGLACCRLLRVDEKRFAPHSSELPYAQVPLELGREIRLLGVVDMELRRIAAGNGGDVPEVPTEFATFWKPEPLPAFPQTGELGKWIAASRLRSGLHLREASYQSARIAELLQDSRYFIARGSLSDYEKSERPPRHVHKIFSLCALYGLALEAFLEHLGLPLAQMGRDPLPDNLLTRPTKRPPLRTPENAGQFSLRSASLSELVAQSTDLPPFLGDALDQLTGTSTASMHDLFWVGGSPGSFHSRLQQTLFVVVDRRKKLPGLARRSSASEQPLAVLQRRDGRFICGRTTLKRSDLVVHSFSDGLSTPVHLRNRVDAEIVGQVVGLIRRIPRSS